MYAFKVTLLTCLYWTTANTALVYLGSVESTGIFVDQQGRAWDEAKKTCENAGFDLITIDTKAKVEFLYNAFSPINFKDRCWTGARDSLKLSQLSWDSSGNDLSPDLVQLESTPSIRTALTFQPSKPTNLTKAILSWRQAEQWYGTLCQTK